MALHVGYFAEPSGSYYSNDYRTTIGTEIEQNFGNEIAGLPNGLVNRKSFDGITILSKDAWEAKSSELLDLPPEAFMWITPTYSATDRSLNVSVRTKILQDIEEGLNIILYSFNAIEQGKKLIDPSTQTFSETQSKTNN